MKKNVPFHLMNVIMEDHLVGLLIRLLCYPQMLEEVIIGWRVADQVVRRSATSLSHLIQPVIPPLGYEIFLAQNGYVHQGHAIFSGTGNRQKRMGSGRGEITFGEVAVGGDPWTKGGGWQARVVGHF